MIPNPLRRAALGASAAALLLLGLAAPAAALDCESDGDCPAGFVCESFGMDVAPCACPEGQECDCPGPDEATEYKACVPSTCDADPQCNSPDLVCIEITEKCPDVMVSAAPDCPPGEECPAPEPPEPASDCEEETQGYCLPKWLGSCSSDGDCGPGFTCTEGEVCECSGGGSSGSSGSAGGGTPTPAPPPGKSDDGDDPNCSCSGSGEFWCQPDEVACAADNDCPVGWTCHEFSSGISTTCVETPDGEGDCGEQPDPAPPKKLCVPPYYEAAFEGGVKVDSDGGVDLGSKEGGGEAHSSPTSGNGGGGPGADPQDPPSSAGSGSPSSSGSGGGSSSCTSAPASDAGPLAVLALVLLALVVVRRRAAIRG